MKMRSTLLVILYTAAVIGLLSTTTVEAACGSRVRKSYDRLTTAERQLYRNAIQLAMDKGYYIKFVEMHTEKRSEMEAHRVCMFTYWHRYLLLGFENMLRSLGPEYACITVPYWDEVQQNAASLAKSCTSVEGCAAITRELGGSTVGVSKSITINGASVSGNLCVTQSPMDHFCEASSKKGSSCAKCIPRGALQKKIFPPTTNYASVYLQIFNATNLPSASTRVENGMHNEMHSILGATMATLQSPADPLFWSHHAYVDLLLSIYFKCKVGFGVLTDEQKKTNPSSFVACPHRSDEDNGYFTTASTVTMRAGENGANPMQVSQPGQALYPFFKSLPSQFYALSDITRLGDNSYTYQVGGLVGQMATKCTAAPSKRRLQKSDRVGCQSDLATEAPAEDPVFVTDDSYDGDVDGGKVLAWVDDVKMKLHEQGVTDDMEQAVELEKMICVFYDKCRGGVTDYSEEFKKAFGVEEPPVCKKIVDTMATGSCNDIKLPNWKETMEEYFPCQMDDQSVQQSVQQSV